MYEALLHPNLIAIQSTSAVIGWSKSSESVVVVMLLLGYAITRNA